MSKRVTGGLAWAGLLLVVAVPSADAITAVFVPQSPSALTSGTDQAALDSNQPLIIAPIPATRKSIPVVTEEAATPAVESVIEAPVEIDPVQTAGIDTVDEFIESGKPLPSYISDTEPTAAPTETAVVEPLPTPEATAETVVMPETEVAVVEAQPEPEISATPVESTIDPVVVASIDPQVEVEVPVPMPATMRPSVSEVALRNLRDQPQSDAVVLPDSEAVLLPNDDEPLRPREDIEFASNDDVVTADELEDWEYGPLSDFLERRQRGDSEVVIRHRSSDFDEDGFFLDEGPNRRRHEPELIGPVDEDDFFFPFLN